MPLRVNATLLATLSTRVMTKLSSFSEVLLQNHHLEPFLIKIYDKFMNYKILCLLLWHILLTEDNV